LFGKSERKVSLAVFDNDQRVVIRKYPISDDGTKIRVVSGGENHWMPSFDITSPLEFPYRAFTSLWRISYRRIYFAKKKGKKCINFNAEQPEIPMPDPEQLKDAVGNTLLSKIGQAEQKTSMLTYFALFINILILLKVMGMI
jgi:hypothetical protein